MASIRLNKDLRSQIVKNIMQSYGEENPIETPLSKIDLCKEPILDICAFFTTRSATYTDICKIAALDITDKNKYNLCVSKGQIAVELPLLGYMYIDADTLKQHEVFKPLSIHVPQLDRYHILGNHPVISLGNLDEHKDDPELQQHLKKLKVKYKEYKALNQSYTELVRQRTSYEERVITVIGGVNTTAQLLEAWPEVERFIPAGTVTPSNIQLPAVCVEELNKYIKT